MWLPDDVECKLVSISATDNAVQCPRQCCSDAATMEFVSRICTCKKLATTNAAPACNSPSKSIHCKHLSGQPMPGFQPPTSAASAFAHSNVPIYGNYSSAHAQSAFGQPSTPQQPQPTVNQQPNSSRGTSPTRIDDTLATAASKPRVDVAAAELFTASTAAAVLIFVNNVVRFLSFHELGDQAIRIWCDNEAAVLVSKEQGRHVRQAVGLHRPPLPLLAGA